MISRGKRKPLRRGREAGISIPIKYPTQNHQKNLAIPKRRIVACVNVSDPDSGFDLDRIDTPYVPAVRETALRISRELGYGALRRLPGEPPASSGCR